MIEAAQQGHLAVVKYLAGEPGAAIEVQDAAGRTALMAAACNGHLDVVR